MSGILNWLGIHKVESPGTACPTKALILSPLRINSGGVKKTVVKLANTFFFWWVECYCWLNSGSSQRTMFLALFNFETGFC